MRKELVAPIVAAIALAGTATVMISSSQAAGTTVDLSMTGHTVAGFTKAQAGQELPVTFTIKNRSTTTSAEVSFYFTVTHATANPSDYTCPLTTTHYNINPDTPACEPGILGFGKSTSAAIMVTPSLTTTTGTVTVKACAYLLDSHTDPVSSNNCKTVSIPIG
jgi:hypothetical protein